MRTAKKLIAFTTWNCRRALMAAFLLKICQDFINIKIPVQKGAYFGISFITLDSDRRETRKQRRHQLEQSAFSDAYGFTRA